MSEKPIRPLKMTTDMILSAHKSWLQLVLTKYDINGNYQGYFQALFYYRYTVVNTQWVS